VIYQTPLFYVVFPISRDPPEGGTFGCLTTNSITGTSFQFLGIPPKGEQNELDPTYEPTDGEGFQFLGIPPKGEHARIT